MNITEVTAIFQTTMWALLRLSTPPLLAALAVGLVISLFQAVTQINEATLSYLPKMLAILAALAIGGAFMYATLANFMHLLFTKMVMIGLS